MCLAIPAEVIAIQGACAEVDIMGIRKEINILLIDHLRPGEHVLVHAGFAISKIKEQEVDSLKALLQKMLDQDGYDDGSEQ